ncbi:MAG: aminoacyl-tRNA hydrolase [Actinomycetales bacterium]
MGAETWLLVGLGNPGPQYADTRHNVGAMVLDTLAGAQHWTYRRHKARAMVAEGRLAPLPGPKVLLAKPTTYMNVSGPPVRSLADYYGITPERVVVVHDELDIPFGSLRLKLGGGEGGHNGLRSVSAALGTREYLRLRVGVGRPPGRMDPADYVLREFAKPERQELDLVRAEAVDALEQLVREGLSATQQRVHAR